jgi:DNA repair protein RecO (recombination protein O)
MANPDCTQAPRRISEQPSFVLHRYPYRETSLIIEAFSRDYGRIALIAKGAKRPYSALRSVLYTFQPLSLSWTGRSAVRLLTRAEWIGGMPPLMGDTLLCGFYANELLVKFCAREEPNRRLFDHYRLTLTRLAHQSPSGQALRAFERLLLCEAGYASAFDRTTGIDAPVTAERAYIFDPEQGVRVANGGDPPDWPVVSGQTLIDIERNQYTCAETLTQSKLLMRFLLHYHLRGTRLKTRQIWTDLHNI